MNLRRFFSTISEPRYALPLLLVVGISVRAIIWLADSAVLWPDSQAYYEFALRIAQNWDYTNYPIYRTPLYPTFLSLFLQFGEGPEIGRAIILAQQSLGLISVIFFYFTARRWGSNAVALLSALCLSMYPLQLYYEVVIQTEVLFGFLLSLVLYYGTLLLQKKEPALAITVGFLLGVASLTRPTAQLLALCLLLPFLVSSRSFSRTMRMALLIFLTAAALVSPWIYWNKIHKDSWGLSRELGLNLYHRIIDVDKLEPPVESIPPEVLKIYEKTRDRSRPTYFTVWYYLLRSNHSELETDRLMAQTALAAARANPGSYLKNTAEIFFRFFFHTRNSIILCETPAHVVLCSGRPVKPLQSFPANFDSGYSFSQDFIKFYFSSVSPPMALVNLIALCWLAAYLIYGRSRRTEYFFILLFVLYFSTLTAIFNREEDRFRLPVDPILLFLFFDCLCHALPLLATKLNLASKPSRT